MENKYSGCRVVTILNKGYIQSINREGPILRKSIPTIVAYSLVKRGYTVYEHHPIDQKIKIKLTKDNFNDEHRFDEFMGVGKPEEKPVIIKNENIATPEQAAVAEAILNTPVRVTTVVEKPTEEKKEEVKEETTSETESKEEIKEDSNTQNLTRKQRRELRRQQMLAEQNAQKENNSETNTVVESESNE